jgi:hypothetical protein
MRQRFFYIHRCVYQGITYYLPFSTTGGKGYCNKGSIGYRDYVAEQGPML